MSCMCVTIVQGVSSDRRQSEVVGASQLKHTLHITHMSNMGVWLRFRWAICGGVIVELFEKGALHADPPNSPPFHAIVGEKAHLRTTIQKPQQWFVFLVQYSTTHTKQSTRHRLMSCRALLLNVDSTR
jgi:hypothetical protein